MSEYGGRNPINRANKRFWNRNKGRSYQGAYRDGGQILRDPHSIGAINARFWGRDDALLNESIREAGGDVPDEEEEEDDEPTGYGEEERDATGAEVGGPPRAEDRKRARAGDCCGRTVRVRVHDQSFKIST